MRANARGRLKPAILGNNGLGEFYKEKHTTQAVGEYYQGNTK